MKKDPNDRHRMINLATGSGKTFVTISAISSLAQKAMVIVDTVDLANQWKNEFIKHSDLSENDILILSGRESVNQAKAGDYKIFIAMHKTLGMLLDEDTNAVNELLRVLKIGVRVFDECHVNFHSICRINSLSNVNFTIFLTATPNRSDYLEDALYEKVFGRVKSYDGTSSEKYHTVIMANFDSHPTDKQKASVKTKYGFCMNKWANFVETEESYKYLFNAINKLLEKFHLIEKEKKIAIMLPTIDLIEKVYDSLEEKYPTLEVGKFIGEIPKQNRANELAKPVILTNHKIFGKGIDVPDLDCVFMCVPISSQVNIKQIIGRLRNNPGHNHVLIDLTDSAYTECIGQMRARKRFYKKIAKEIKEINEIL